MQYSIQSEDWTYSLGSMEESMVPISPSFGYLVRLGVAAQSLLRIYF
jgi:hypothetical protein